MVNLNWFESFVYFFWEPLFFCIALPAVNSSASIGDHVVVLFLKLWLVSSSPTSLSLLLLLLLVHPLPTGISPFPHSLCRHIEQKPNF